MSKTITWLQDTAAFRSVFSFLLSYNDIRVNSSPRFLRGIQKAGLSSTQAVAFISFLDSTEKLLGIRKLNSQPCTETIINKINRIHCTINYFDMEKIYIMA